MWNFLYMTFKCVLDLGGSELVVALCTSPHHGDHLCQNTLKTFHEFKTYGADTKTLPTDRLTDGHMEAIPIKKSYRLRMNWKKMVFMLRMLKYH